MKVEEGTISLSIYDNGGQKVFRSIQHLLLSRNCVYIVVFNLNNFVGVNNPNRQESLEHMRYWLSSIEMDARGGKEKNTMFPPVVLVGTHYDEIGKGERKELLCKIDELLNEEFGSTNIFIDTLKGNSEQSLCFWPVDNTDPEDCNIKNLRRLVIEAIINDPMGYLEKPVPVSWLEAMDELTRLSQEQPTVPLISDAEKDDTSTSSVNSVLNKFSVFGNINKEEEDYKERIQTRTQAFLKFCFELGTFIYFPRISVLQDYCILDSQWLLDSMTYIVRDFKLHRFRRDYKAMELENGDHWNNLLQRGILHHSLLLTLWPGERENFKFLVNVMVRLGIFGMLYDEGTNTEPRYTVPSVVTEPSIMSREEMSLPNVLNYLNLNSNSNACIETIGIKRFVIVPFYNRLANLLSMEWKKGYHMLGSTRTSTSTIQQPTFLPSACNLRLGPKHPFSLILNDEEETISIMASNEKIMDVILPIVIDACNTLNKDIYTGRLSFALPKVQERIIPNKERFRSNDPLVPSEFHKSEVVVDEDTKNVQKLAEFFVEKNTTIVLSWAHALFIIFYFFFKPIDGMPTEVPNFKL